MACWRKGGCKAAGDLHAQGRTIIVVTHDRNVAEVAQRIVTLVDGRVVTDEAKAFLDDPSPDKRAKLIDRLLDDPAWADHWAVKWGDLVRGNPSRVGVKPDAVWNFTPRRSLKV
mgnify:CR=1 FL=1